ncbi:hypothetical protein BDW60DRAFT_205772 [Aspergillus nidulans var. acristatus]
MRRSLRYISLATASATPPSPWGLQSQSPLLPRFAKARSPLLLKTMGLRRPGEVILISGRHWWLPQQMSRAVVLAPEQPSYISFSCGSVPNVTPIPVLRGFEVSLGVSESKNVSFHLTRRDLGYWDVQSQDWRIPGGEIQVSVGLGLRNLPLHSSVTLI